MRKQFFLIVIPGLIIGVISYFLITAFANARPAAVTKLLEPIKTGKASAADKQIEKAQSDIKNKPTDPRGFNLLASAFIQKSRETGDFSLNDRATESIEQSLKIAPDNFDALKLKATLLLNYHRFSEALEVTKRAQSMNPRDHEIFGAMVDSLVELGKYDQAVDAAQKMVDLRPDTASYSRISYLRSLHGDQPGAIEMMKMAATSANPQNPENGAWCRVHLGDELMNYGKPEEAEKQYDNALYVFPDYHPALAAKARARFASGDADNAVIYYKRAIERVPLPDYIAALGDLYAKLGRKDESKQLYDQVEFIEKTGSGAGTYSRQLALFWADHDMRLDEALTAAQAERAARSDIYASDLLAWCLYKNGKFSEAQASINEALRLGSRDPKILFHAGMITIASGDTDKGGSYLKQALTLNPFFDVLQAEVAKEKLASLNRK